MITAVVRLLIDPGIPAYCRYGQVGNHRGEQTAARAVPLRKTPPHKGSESGRTHAPAARQKQSG